MGYADYARSLAPHLSRPPSPQSSKDPLNGALVRRVAELAIAYHLLHALNCPSWIPGLALTGTRFQI